MNIDYILQNHGIGGGGVHKDKTPPPPCTNFTATSGNALVTLNWINPIDTDFVGIKILRKTGSYPTSPTDGTLVYSGANTSYVDNTVINSTTYNYRAFTFDYDNNFNTTESGQEATATPVAYVIYGVKIDTTNSNPETAVTYIESSIGFTKATGNNGAFNYGSWADKFPFNLIKPCKLLNGVVNHYLNKNNFNYKEDGITASNLTSTNTDGEIMIEFPKIYWKIETIGTDIYIRFSNGQIDSSYKCLAHMRGTTEKDKCYIGSYLGYYRSSDSKLISVSGQNPTASKTIGAFRTSSQLQGTGYDQIGYFQLLMLQILYVVMFKSLDSQTALGRGYVDGNASAHVTGGTNAKSMYYGETTGKQQMKCFGIEDLWGNLYSFIDGIITDASRNVLIGNQSFNDSGTGYTNYGQGATATISGLINTIQGDTEKGFIIKSGGGSATTYYTDIGTLSASSLASFSRAYNEANSVGIFSFSISNKTAYSNSLFSSRLMYL